MIIHQGRGRLVDGWQAAQPGDPAGKATEEIRETNNSE